MASDLDRYIYPYSPAAIDPLSREDGKSVIRLSVAPDVPPVVGVYLYSSQPLDPGAKVTTEHLYAYRRVGRTNRKVPDFMWLRSPVASDPLMLIDIFDWDTRIDEEGLLSIHGLGWIPSGSGAAHGLTFRIDPEGLAAPQASFRSLPGSSEQRAGEFRFKLDVHKIGAGVWVVADYQDDWGCRWQARRYLRFVSNGQAILEPTAAMNRRIVELPAQRATA